MQDPASRVQAFLAAGHVCTVVGYASYAEFCQRFRVPVVVAGFEPLDLLAGILACVEQLETGRSEPQNCYGRSVRIEGNPQAQALVDDVYEPCDRVWRGLGMMPRGGLRLRAAWQDYDARRRFGVSTSEQPDLDACCAGDVLAGHIKPTQCPQFGRGCTPETPIGAPMVSSEGACAAYYRYARAALQPVTIEFTRAAKTR